MRFNNCKFIGQYCGYSGNYIFNNCYIDANDEGFWTYGANSMTFKNCIFHSGKSRAIHMYQDGTAYNVIINIQNCHFFAEEPFWDIWAGNAYVAVVEIKSTTTNSEVNFTGHNTKSETYKADWYRKFGDAINCKVTSDGIEATP